MNKFLDVNGLIKKHNNINDFIRNNKKVEFQCFNTRNKCYRIAVDTMLYAHKFKYSYNDIVYGFVNQIINFLSNRILPIYIIDGIAPDEKSDIIKSRNDKKIRIESKINALQEDLKNESDLEKIKEIKKKISHLKKSNIKISKEDIDLIVEIANLFGIPCIRAKGEADALIGKLYANNSIDACLSEDMDLLIFGCKKMIKFQNKKICEYDLDYILFKLQISFSQFLDMCLLFGCDYLKPIHKIDTQEIYTNICNNSIENLIKKNINKEHFINYLEEFENAKKLFQINENSEYIRYTCFKINITINEDILDKLGTMSKGINKKRTEFQSDIFYINTLIKDNKFI